MSFGENLIRLMKEKNISQKDLANALGISTATLYRYRGNQTEPKPSCLTKIADCLNCSPQQLLGKDRDDIKLSEAAIRIARVISTWPDSKQMRHEYYVLGMDEGMRNGPQ